MGDTPNATPTAPTSPLNNSFGAYEAGNDQAMGLDKISSEYADQKNVSQSDWKSNLREGLAGMAQTKLDDLTQFNNHPMSYQPGGIDQTTNAQKRGSPSSDYYTQLMQNQFNNWQMSQVPRYKRGIVNG